MLVGIDFVEQGLFGQDGIGSAHFVTPAGEVSAVQHHNVGIQAGQRFWQHNVIDFIPVVAPGHIKEVDRRQWILPLCLERASTHFGIDPGGVQHFLKCGA